jgi:glycosyltransferase involved in cell wall biosynthesis
MKVQIVDPSAQTPPYDRALAAGLARAGAEVELVTSHFVHGPPPPADGYAVDEQFYRRSARLPSNSLRRRTLGLAEHVPGMLRHRRSAREADVVHYQWLTIPALDAYLLPPGPARVMTAHGFLRGAESGPSAARALERMDAVIALSRRGAERLREGGVDPARIHVIPHGAFDYLTQLPEESPLPPELQGAEGPVILSFGVIRPYKGIDVLLRAFAAVEGAELWIVGRPLGADLPELHRLAAAAPGPVRMLTRFVPDSEVPAIMRRADIVALPYRDVDQSGVLYTALAFGKPIVASAVGGFGEVLQGHGAGRLVAPGDPNALAAALRELLSQPAERARLGEAALAAARGPYSWDSIAARTLDLYRQVLDR